MNIATLPRSQEMVEGESTVQSAIGKYFSELVQAPDAERLTKRQCAAGLLLLLLVMAIQLVWTWKTWGDASIDLGHETYVPSVLAEGKMLYRDVWYHYGPAAPYFNSSLFRIFGVNLGVLSASGSLAALGCSILLFLSGAELGFAIAGWTAGAVVLLEAFQPGLFCFPLPYSFASVYGCLTACALLWTLLRALKSRRWVWMLASGTLAAIASLLKLEYGIACYAAVGLALLLRGLKEESWKFAAADFVALLPGLALCAVVIRWMIGMRGAEFITQENIMSWPTTFFMKNYGSAWLERTGFAFNWAAFKNALMQTAFYCGIMFVVHDWIYSGKQDSRRILIRCLAVAGLVAFYHFKLQEDSVLEAWGAAFFPRAMALYTAIAAVIAIWSLRRSGLKKGSLGIILALVFASLLSFRMLLKMTPTGYAIYYNGPEVLAYLALVTFLWRKYATGRSIAKAAFAVSAACLVSVPLATAMMTRNWPPVVPLHTEYGTMRVPEGVARNYEAGIAFLKDKNQRGESVLIVPEDTTMYFLSGTHAPTRVYAFNPGVVAPGRMTEELFQQIGQQNVRYLLWSNRIYPEYGVPSFGRDFNQELATFLKARYRLVGPLVPRSYERWRINFNVWERKDAEASR